MIHSRPTHHQMVCSLRAEVNNNMEELARRTGIPVNALWRGYNNQEAKLNGWGRTLEEYYYRRFPDGHFSRFFAIRDEKLQNAFQLAVKKDSAAGKNTKQASDPNESDPRDRTELRRLFEEDWTWLSGWDYTENKAGEKYLRARYLLIAGWTGVPLDPQLDRLKALRWAKTEADACSAELDRSPERLHQRDLKMKVAKLKISSEQRLHLLEYKEHLPVTQAISTDELSDLLQYLLFSITIWPQGHFNRWQWARDAVTISSGLELLDECSRAYAILLDERPDFANIDHPEWSVGPAADDPDLKFFRKNVDSIRNNKD